MQALSRQLPVSVGIILLLALAGNAIPAYGQAEGKSPATGQAVFFGENIVKGYHPEPSLVTPVNAKVSPRYPVTDIHTHFSLDTDVELLIRKMDELGVRRIVNLSGGWGEHLEQMLEKFYKPYPDRIAIFSNIDFSAIDEPDFAVRTADALQQAHARGVKGLKIFKAFGLTIKDGSGTTVPIDDPRLDPVWSMAGRLGMPVLIHVADPAAFFNPVDEHNERWLQLALHPDWSFHGDAFASREELFAQRNRVLARHPDTKFIGAHVGSHADDLQTAAEAMEKYPNLYLEIAGRVAALGRQPYATRKLLIRYQDRILFGTDRYPGRPQQPRYRIYYRFLETDDEYFDYYEHPFPPTGEWKIYGIFLPEDVLQKIYFRNAQDLLGA